MGAFPSESELAQVVRFGLDESLAAIAGSGNLRDMVFGLIEWAISHGELDRLLLAAYRLNPRNPALYRVAAQLGLLEG